MEFEISKIDAAVEQLDWSIRLFLDHKAYVPAITLAGAAEEIIGECLGDQSAFFQLKLTLGAKYSLPDSVVSQQYLNKAKNWLKHWKALKDQERFVVDLDEAAIQYIIRGLANLITHDRSLPSEGPRFIEWLSLNRAEPCNL